jgi:hypothetical protein
MAVTIEDMQVDVQRENSPKAAPQAAPPEAKTDFRLEQAAMAERALRLRAD